MAPSLQLPAGADPEAIDKGINTSSILSEKDRREIGMMVGIMAKVQFGLENAMKAALVVAPLAFASPAFSEDATSTDATLVEAANTLTAQNQKGPLRDAEGRIIILASADANANVVAETQTGRKTPNQIYIEELLRVGQESSNLPRVVSDAFNKARALGFEPDEFTKATPIAPQNRDAWINNIKDAPQVGFEKVSGWAKKLTADNYSIVVRNGFYDLSEVRSWLKNDQGQTMTDIQFQTYEKQLLGPRIGPNKTILPSQAEAWAGKLEEWRASGNSETADKTLELFNLYAPQLVDKSREAYRRLLVICSDIAMTRYMKNASVNSTNVISNISELAILMGLKATQLSYKIPSAIPGKFTKINNLVIDRELADKMGVADVFDMHYPQTAQFSANQIVRALQWVGRNIELANSKESLKKSSDALVQARQEANTMRQEAKAEANAMRQEAKAEANAMKQETELYVKASNGLEKVQGEIEKMLKGKSFDAEVLNQGYKEYRKNFPLLVDIAWEKSKEVLIVKKILSGIQEMARVASIKRPEVANVVAILIS